MNAPLSPGSTLVTRFSLAMTLALSANSALIASSRYSFETANAAATTDGLVLAEQYRPASAFRFSRVDGGAVVIAKKGAPYTAFSAGMDTATPTAGDALLATDPWEAECGASFVKLPGTAASALIITLDYPTAAASGLLLDIDADETWAIRAYSDAGSTLVAETVLGGGTVGTGDQKATPWAVVSNSANIVQLRIVQTGSNPHAGAALDLFRPYGLAEFDSGKFALAISNGPVPNVGLALQSSPGHRILIQKSASMTSGSWTTDSFVTPGAPWTAFTSSTGGVPRLFYKANGPVPLVDRSTAIYNSVSAFVATLTPAQATSIIYPANDATQRARWSNLPTGIFQRNGLKIGLMSQSQKDALWAMLATILSPEGFQKISRIVSGDDTLAPMGNLIFGSNEYYVSFVGTPSLTGKYLLQFGGHHLATNITIKGAQATIAPALPGAQPTSYTYSGRTVRPIGDEYDLSFALMNSMTTEQRTVAILSTTTRDLALGPGQDGVTLLPEGIKASALTDAQRAILLDLIGKNVNIIHDDASAAKVASVKAALTDSSTNGAIYFSWRGPTTANSAAYYRIQGPNLFIEWAPQAMGGSAINHIHAMYRELTNDYGAQISE
jgi:hypothetical protein